MSARLAGPALLFCPADRPDRVLRAAVAADMVIVDLEDGVRPDARASARASLREMPLDPERCVIRVNPARSADFSLDVAAVLSTSVRTIMLAKTESVADIDATPEETEVIALCETARGVLAAAEIAAHPRVIAVMWGAEDLIASLGGTASRHADGRYRDVARHARSHVLLAAGAAGKAAIDAVHLDIADLDGLADECADGAASGFAATACIHPSQVPVVRQAYQPSDEQVQAALALLDAASGAAGVFRFEGRMVDEPVLAHARAVLTRAGLSAP